MPDGADVKCLARGVGCGQCGCPSENIRGKAVETDLFESTPIQLIYRIFSNFNCIESSLNSETLILDSSQLHSRQRGFSGSEESPFDSLPWSVASPASPMNGRDKVDSPQLDALFYSLWKLGCPKVRGSKPLAYPISIQVVD